MKQSAFNLPTMNYQGSIWDFLFGGGGGGGGVDPKKNFWSHAAARKIFFRPSRGSGHGPPENFEKRGFRVG